jgi:hypothetical protein
MTEPFVLPFKIIVDGAEKLPYRFQGLSTDAALKSRPLVVPVEWAHLKTGDYSIEGWKKHVTVERKTKNDLYTTLGQGRARFEREHERMAAMGAGSSIVVIEASWDEILNDPPRRSRLHPKTVFRTFLSWSQKYCVPWYAMESRRFAEITTFRWLEKWWYSLQEQIAEESKTCKRCGKPLRSKRSVERGAGHVCSRYGE